MKKSEGGAPAQLQIPISHADKVFRPNEGCTKLNLAEYYNAIFPELLPYIKDRMLALERCPDGMLGECFFQKQKPRNMPAGTPSKRLEYVTSTGRFTDYVVGGSLATQLALVNLGCIAVHVMGSRTISPRQPDWICIDIDPETGLFADAARAALKVKAALDVLKLLSYPKTSGSRGLHVFVPIRVGPDADQVLAFARSFVGRVASAHPNEFTVEHAVAARGGRVYLDPFRNGFGQTLVAPYSVRRREKRPFLPRWTGRRSRRRSSLPIPTWGICPRGLIVLIRGATSLISVRRWRMLPNCSTGCNCRISRDWTPLISSEWDHPISG
jgi:bifunctional non-homologous end joining protein LigD